VNSKSYEETTKSVLNSDNHYERQYNCKNCDYFTNNPRSVLYHRKEFHSEKINIYECAYCQYASQYSGKVERHTLLRHKINISSSQNGKKTIKQATNTITNNSHLFDYSTLNQTDYTEEEPIESMEYTDDCTQSNNYKCPYCTYHTADNQSEYISHVRDHLNGKSFRCVLCNLLYKYRGDCVVHLKRKHRNVDIQAHSYVDHFNLDTVDPNQIYILLKPKQNLEEESDEKLFSCSYCDYKANYKGDVFKHQSRKHTGQPKNVIHLNSTINNSTNLNETNNNNNNDNSNLIDIDYNNTYNDEYNDEENMFNYEDQIDSFNENNESILHNQSSQSENRFQCKFCSHIGKSHAKLQLHLATHYNLKQFMCPICNQRANFKWDIQKHIRKIHNDTESQVICLSESEARDSITSYIESKQTSQQPPEFVQSEPIAFSQPLLAIKPKIITKKFKCSLCIKTSDWQWDIRKHLREMHKNQQGADVIVLNGIAATKCTESQANINLSSVCADSTGNKKFKCTQCPYRSNWKADLFRHLKKRHHVDEPQLKNITILDNEYASKSLEEYEQTHGINVKKRSRTDINNTIATTTTANNSINNCSTVEMMSYSNLFTDLTNGEKTSKSPVKIAELNIKPYECCKCGFRTDRKSDALRHIRVKHEQTPLNAFKLLKIMSVLEAKSTIDSYENMRLFNKLKTISSTNQEEMNVYNNSNNLEQEYYKCPYCELKVENKFEMKQHLEIHFQNKKYVTKKTFQCSMCFFKSKLRFLIRKHISETHSIQKAFILKKEQKQLVVNNYVETANEQKTNLNNNNNNNKSMTIDDSNKITESIKLTATDGTIVDATYAINNTSQKKEYFCQKCPYKTRNFSNLKQHLVQHRPQQGYFKCRYCVYYVSQVRLIKQHEILHPEFQVRLNN